MRQASRRKGAVERRAGSMEKGAGERREGGRGKAGRRKAGRAAPISSETGNNLKSEPWLRAPGGP